MFSLMVSTSTSLTATTALKLGDKLNIVPEMAGG
jgi:molybdopterin converting factor small subunit